LSEMAGMTGAGGHTPAEPDGLSRRTFLERAGLLGAATTLTQLTATLGARGLLAEAQAVETDVVRDTLNGFIAFILPGNDDYSVAQGESAGGPGGIGGGTLNPFIAALDGFVPASALGQPSMTLPASGGVATLLNSYALQVNPAAASGSFLSPFARLSFKEKGEVMRRFESDALASGAVEELRFVSGILPGFVGFLAASEAGVYDPATRSVRSQPVGWALSGYGGPAEGHPEFLGYYQGRKSVAPKRRRRSRRRRRRRRS
jgi:hypothetical protein